MSINVKTMNIIKTSQIHLKRKVETRLYLSSSVYECKQASEYFCTSIHYWMLKVNIMWPLLPCHRCCLNSQRLFLNLWYWYSLWRIFRQSLFFFYYFCNVKCTGIANKTRGWLLNNVYWLLNGHFHVSLYRSCVS